MHTCLISYIFRADTWKLKEFMSKSVWDGMEYMEQNQYESVDWPIDKHSVAYTQQKMERNINTFNSIDKSKTP